MKRIILLSFLLSLSLPGNSVEPRNNQLDGGRWAGCVQSFYGEKPMDLYTLRNDCGMSMMVHYRAKSPKSSTCWGLTTMQSGQVAHLGKTEVQVKSCGGIALAVCPLGSAAVDRNGKLWGRGSGRQYRCQEGLLDFKTSKLPDSGNESPLFSLMD